MKIEKTASELKNQIRYLILTNLKGNEFDSKILYSEIEMNNELEKKRLSNALTNMKTREELITSRFVSGHKNVFYTVNSNKIKLSLRGKYRDKYIKEKRPIKKPGKKPIKRPKETLPNITFEDAGKAIFEYIRSLERKIKELEDRIDEDSELDQRFPLGKMIKDD